MDKTIAILKKIFVLPGWLVWILGIGAGAALGWVFLTGQEASWIAYPVYVLAFYGLTVFCVWGVPVCARLYRNRKNLPKEALAEAHREALSKSLHKGLLVNGAYAVFNLGMGWYLRSDWMGSNGIYYLVNAVIMRILVGCERRMNDWEALRREKIRWRVYELVGYLLFAVNVTMTGVVFQIIWRDEGDSYPGVTVFAVAAYTFYKLTMAIIRVIQCRRSKSPILGAARNMDMIEALMSLLQLQTALFASFGQGFEHQLLMNSLTGGAVCLSVMLGSLGMVIHGRKRRKEIRGVENDGQ